jgi:hypothetical protein
VTERIKAVQRIFWSLLAISLVVALLGLPLGDDAATMDALSELTAFQANFDREGLERDLLARASAQGVVIPAEVASKVVGPGTPKLRAAQNAPPVQPDASLALASLAQISALSSSESTLEIGKASAEALSQGLGWRLSRQPGGGSFELAKIELTRTGCSAKDLEREREVVQARSAAQSATAAGAAATKRHAEAEELSQLRRKWKAPWKAILKADEKRAETLAARDEALKVSQQADQRYEALAKEAEAAATAGAPAGDAADCAIAIASVRELPSGPERALRMPTPIERKRVPVPKLSGVEFPTTHAAGLWDVVADRSLADAIAKLRGRFTWHYRHVEVAGIPVGGMTVLQFAPLLLLPLFFSLIKRSRGLSALYNPFDQPTTIANLPSVGFGAGSLNLVVLVVLPLVACALCAWSLIEIDQPPLVPLLCGIASLALGGFSHVALHELLELRDAITRSHSNPPPAPSAP